MPLIDISYAPTVPEAVACPEEPYDHAPRPGHAEVRSTWFESRATSRRQRVADLHDAVTAATGRQDFGVYLSLPIATWSQGD